MKIKVQKNTFQRALSRIEGIIPVREIRSSLSNILIEIKSNQIMLTASDLEITISILLETEVIEEGTTSLPAKKLNQVINELQEESISISSKEDGYVDISGLSKKNGTHIRLMSSPAKDYPNVPSLSKDTFTEIPVNLLMEVLSHTSFAMAKEDARYIFNGLFVISEGSRCTFVSTDGRRLALVHRDFSYDLPFSEGIILPHKTVKELQKFSDTDQKGSVAYDNVEKKVYFKIGNVTVISKLIEGNFPDYNKVVPKKVDHELLFNRESFQSSIRQVAVMAQEPSRQILFNFSQGNLHLHAHTADMGEAKNTMSIDYQGEDVSVAFNSKYIMDVLGCIQTENIIFGFSSSDSPAVIRKPGDDDFIAVVMPMKVYQ